MKCAYSAGALVALANELNFKKPDFLLASSGSSGSAFYYMAGQYTGIKNIWTNLLTSRKFISLFRFWKIMDIDYLIDFVFKQQEPLDLSAVNKSDIDYWIPVTDKNTGITELKNKKDNLDGFEILRASKAMPIIYGKSVVLNGKNYIDGALNLNFEDLINYAFKLGAEKIIVIDNRLCKPLILKLLYTLFFKMKFGRNFKKSIFCNENKKREDNLLFINNAGIKSRLLTINKKTLENTFEQGYQDVKDNAMLKNFIHGA